MAGLAGLDPDGARTPVEVVESQARDLARPQAQPGGEEQDRPVPKALRRRVERGDQAGEVGSTKVPRQGRQPAAGHHRDSLLQPVLTQTLGPDEAQERSQRGGEQLDR